MLLIAEINLKTKIFLGMLWSKLQINFTTVCSRVAPEQRFNYFNKFRRWIEVEVIASVSITTTALDVMHSFACNSINGSAFVTPFIDAWALIMLKSPLSFKLSHSYENFLNLKKSPYKLNE